MKEMLAAVKEKFNSSVFQKMKQMIDKYNLISEKDVVAVELSCDKNAVALLSGLAEYQKEMNQSFEIRAFAVGAENQEEKAALAKRFGITSYEVIEEGKEEAVYQAIETAGCNVVALPHNYNDIVSSTFMTLMQRKEAAKLYPKRTSSIAKGFEFIRPLCIVETKDIVAMLEKEQIAITESESLFGKLAYIEEGIYDHTKENVAEYHFAVYEGM